MLKLFSVKFMFLFLSWIMCVMVFLMLFSSRFLVSLSLSCWGFVLWFFKVCSILVMKLGWWNWWVLMLMEMDRWVVFGCWF